MPLRVGHVDYRSSILTYGGLSLTISDWARRQGMTKQALEKRLAMGWPLEKALCQPVARRRRKVVE